MFGCMSQLPKGLGTWRGKANVQKDKVNLVLKLFGEELKPVKIEHTV